MPLAEWDVSTRGGFEGYVRRTIRPGLGHLKVRRVQGPILDTFYARLKKCGDLACSGKPFTEHHNVPDLRPSSDDRRPDWEQVAGRLRAAIESGTLLAGWDLPSVRDLQAWQVKPGTIRQIHSILSDAFEASKRWKWVDDNPAESAKPPTVTQVKRPATSPADVAKVIAESRAREMHQIALYLWLAAITGMRRGEFCAVQICDLDLEHGLLHVAFNYVVKCGQKVRKDTKTHQDRWVALDEASVAFIREHLDVVGAALATVGLELAPDAYLFSNDPMHAVPWNPDWASHKVSDLAAAAGVELNIKKLRHYTASQLLAGRFDLQNTAARLGHGGGGATTLKHYADPVSEVDRRAAAYLAELTGGHYPVDQVPGPRVGR